MSEPPDFDLPRDVEKVLPLVFRYARRACKVHRLDSETAHDIAQSVFAKLWEVRDTFDYRGWPQLLAYVQLLVRTAVRDSQKGSIRWDKAWLIDKHHRARRESDPGLFANVEKCIPLIRDPVTREAVRLRFVEGLTLAEISERLGMPLTSVRTRIIKGMVEIETCIFG